MTDNLSVFWQNNERARALFYDLLDRTQRNAYDDDFLARLAAYREAGGDAVHADIFAAQYLLYEGDAESAALCGERAYKKRPTSLAVCKVLACTYTALCRPTDALVMEGRAAKLTDRPLQTNCPPELLTAEVLDRLSVAMGKPSYAPMALSRMSYDAAAGFTAHEGVFAGEFLPQETDIHPPYYVATYTEQEQQGNKAWLLHTIEDAKGFAENVGGEFVYDLIRARRAPGRAEITLAAGQEVVLPVLGVQGFQRLHMKTDSLEKDTPLSPATPNFFRLTERTTLSSDHAFLVGTPISVGHSPQRRPLVLNLLADALPWEILGAHFAEWMPNTARFFARGVIFDQHFSVSEYTYPSLPTIETGMYPHHSHIFNDKIAISLPPEYVTLSERMRTLGYATASLMGDGIGVYNGTTRGYDRLLISGYRTLAYEGVERTIRHLEGMRDVDHFIFLHAMDAHPWPYPLFQVTASVQARLSLTERLSGAEGSEPSPYLRSTPLSIAACQQGIRNLDRALGTLFSYLEQNYAPEEYLVNLYSDHGVPVFSKGHFIVSPAMTHSTWMMRGAGVPEGARTDELTSAVDIYPALAHLLGFPVDDNVDGVLPRVFGGTGREIAYSNSLYPGRPYCLRARTRTHTFHLESEDGVAPNGTVDLARAETAIYPRAHEGEAGCEVDSPELRAFFYPRVRAFLQGIGNNGEQFPPPKEI